MDIKVVHKIMSIPDRLKAVRVSYFDCSQKVMAGHANCTLRAWQSYEKPEGEGSLPGSKVLQGLAQKGININWVLTGDGDMLSASKLTPETTMPTANLASVADKLKHTSATWRQAIDAVGYEPPAEVAENIKTTIFEGQLSIESVARLLLAIKENLNNV